MNILHIVLGFASIQIKMYNMKSHITPHKAKKKKLYCPSMNTDTLPDSSTDAFHP